MKAWRFTLEGSPIEMSTKLESELRSIGGFVFDTNRMDTTSVTFKIRKRILYPWYMAFQNWTVVKGEMLHIATEKETKVKISFTLHFFIMWVVSSHLVLVFGFLIAIVFGNHANTAMNSILGVLLALGIVMGFAVQQKFERDIRKYKLLLTQIFEIQ